jgi:hydrophobic/amphiphilic exporter-1 (mainly G- bacteria), HAE1 family
VPAPRTDARSEGIYGIVVSRPVAISMAFIAAMVFGRVSYTRLPLNLFPDLTYPTLTVRTEYPGAAPEEVENQVCRLIEAELSTIPSLIEITSISRAELGDVVMEFDWDTDMDEVSQMVRERISRLTFPEEVRNPLLLRYDPSLDPILRVGLAGGDDLFLLRHLSEDLLRRQLEVIPGVAAVKVRGGLEREIVIEVDEGRLAGRGLTIDAVSRRLASENVNLAGGSIKQGDTEYLIRTLNEFLSVEEIAEVMLPCPDGTPTRLGDVAEVRATHREREVVGHIDGQESVEVRIYREADANIVTVARAVKTELFGTPAQQAYVKAYEEWQATQDAEAAAGAEVDGGEDKARKVKKAKKAGKRKGKGKGKGGGKGPGGPAFDPASDAFRDMTAFLAYQLPEGVELHTVADQSRFIEDSIADVKWAAALGGLLVVMIIFLFLRDLWSTLIISLSIPMSVVITFTPMFLAEVSLNLMSLGGLALGIGMLVDSSIVVLESIYRCREDGDGPREAAIRGTREVAAAVAASTFTTVAVFFPIVFVKGVAGQLFGNLALTVVFSLLASLAVALFFIPMLAARRLDTVPKPATRLGTLQQFGPRAAWGQFKDSWAGLRRRRREATGLRKLLWLALLLPGLGYLLVRLAVMVPMSIISLLMGAVVGALGKIAVRVARFGGSGGGFVMRPLLRAFDAGHAAVERGYLALLSGALAARGLVLVVAVLLFGGAVLLASQLGQELIPTVHQGEFDVELSMPVGTPLEETLAVMEDVEHRVAAVDGVAKVLATAGTEKTSDAELGKGEHTIDLHILVAEAGRLDLVEARIQEQLRKTLGEVPGLTVRIRQPALFSFRAPVEVAIYEHDLVTLRRDVYEVVDSLSRIDALQDVRTDLRPGFPELRITYDREQLVARGLDLLTVAQSVRDKVEGNVATDLRGRDDRIDVRVRLRPSQVDREDDIRHLNVNPAGYPPIDLDSVADLVMDEGPSEIRHIDQRRAGLVTASLEEFDLGAASSDIDGRLSTLARRSGLDYDIRGQSREMEVSLQSLKFALALAVFLVYVIMAATFESFRHPFVILFSIPLAIVGVIPVLGVVGIPISVLVLIGGIVLAGIVVNNAIVLVDYVNQLRRRGLDLYDALRTAGRARLRPILITTLTTALGLTPMAVGVGRGFEIRQSLAVTVIAGLIASTLLTLVVVPVVYSLLAGKDTAKPEPTSEDADVV